MKTIKVIDLLNKIANGEEVPKTIKYGRHIYNYEEGTYDWSYYIENNGTMKFLLTDVFNSYENTLDLLNDEVEIIEDTLKEDKKIEKLGAFNIKKFYDDYPETAHFILEMFKKQEELIDKVNGDK